ncbi:MAG: hypothetical protein NW214_12145 [Pseudanabaenaceae cyanobacterium bins.39]|nr:hypothetical protein [Pseudanabaenaceae cyanobacterium bins.39]
MKTISIAVEPEIQVAFEQANDEDRQALGALISSFLKKRWASRNLTKWQETVKSSSGAWSDFPDLDEIRANLGQDVPREPI